MSTGDLKLMCVLAHPDDESLGTGGTLAHYAAEGVATYLVTATRGEHGRLGQRTDVPDPEEVGRIREAELRRAAVALGLTDVQVLGYPDAGLDRVDPRDGVAAIVGHLRRVAPQVVVTFGPDGAYGHPDHIAISQLTTAAVMAAADPTFDVEGAAAPHRVSKLYYLAWDAPKWAAYQAALRKLTITVDGCERQAVPWQPWAITTHIDTSGVWPAVWRAVSCHESQMAIYQSLRALPDAHHRALWGTQAFYRVFSTVNGGRTQESDLFEGLR
jgi:LmbE family N-acetylglucosaminyl deacetylase